MLACEQASWVLSDRGLSSPGKPNWRLLQCKPRCHCSYSAVPPDDLIDYTLCIFLSSIYSLTLVQTYLHLFSLWTCMHPPRLAFVTYLETFGSGARTILTVLEDSKLICCMMTFHPPALMEDTTWFWYVVCSLIEITVECWLLKPVMRTMAQIFHNELVL